MLSRHTCGPCWHFNMLRFLKILSSYSLPSLHAHSTWVTSEKWRLLTFLWGWRDETHWSIPFRHVYKSAMNTSGKLLHMLSLEVGDSASCLGWPHSQVFPVSSIFAVCSLCMQDGIRTGGMDNWWLVVLLPVCTNQQLPVCSCVWCLYFCWLRSMFCLYKSENSHNVMEMW